MSSVTTRNLLSRRKKPNTEAAVSIDDLRRSRDLAIKESNWRAGCYFARLICSVSHEYDAQDRLQYGHMLKELGAFDAAEGQYRDALSLNPTDPEAYLQLGHLMKVRGDYPRALTNFEQALALGYSNTSHISAELSVTKNVLRLSQPFGSSQKCDGVGIFISSPANASSKDGLDLNADSIGTADYSYNYIVRGYIAALEAQDIDYKILPHPEYVADVALISPYKHNLHIGVCPPFKFRILKGAYNVVCFAWEFSRLETAEEICSYHAFSDQTTMLNSADEVWTLSNFGVRAISASVHRPVHCVPTPMLSPKSRPKFNASSKVMQRINALAVLDELLWQPLAICPRLQRQMDETALDRSSSINSILASDDVENVVIYVSVFNAHDYRKQVRPMLEAFVDFLTTHPNAFLLLKVTSPNADKSPVNSLLSMHQLGDASSLLPPLVSNRVWLTSEFVTTRQLNAIYALASFYICTSHAEGQNLPLIEAMSSGVVPVTPIHTAMEDYINGENAVIISHDVRILTPRLANRYKMLNLTTQYISASQALSALNISANLSSEEYAALSTNAVNTVREKFSKNGFIKSLNETIAVAKGGERC